MARARNIKPSFFTNDQLAEVSCLGRLLFIGLWTIADREGRLEDRPKKIKAEVLPYDECDPDSLLNDLEMHGFILRYESGNAKYIQILTFTKHQNPHQKEAASIIPAPDKHQTSTVQDTTFSGASPADSLLLIPDSPLPITDPLQSDPLLSVAPQEPRPKKGSSLPKDWTLPKPWGEWAMRERPELSADAVRGIAEQFKDHWHANSNQAAGKKSDWEAAWRNWVRREKSFNTARANTVQESRLDTVRQIMGGGNGKIRTIIDVTASGSDSGGGAYLSATAGDVWEPDGEQVAGIEHG